MEKQNLVRNIVLSIAAISAIIALYIAMGGSLFGTASSCLGDHSTKTVCEETCSDSCVKDYTTPEGVDCFVCKEEVCPEGSMKFTQNECEDHCGEQSCVSVRYINDEFSCYKCAQKAVETTCVLPSVPKDECVWSCLEGECERTTNSPTGEECYICSTDKNVPDLVELTCEEGTMTNQECLNDCIGKCALNYSTSDGLKCYTCEEETVEAIDPVEVHECEGNTIPQDQCLKGCSGVCKTMYTDESGVICQQCQAQTVHICPEGTLSDKDVCDSQCTLGICAESTSVDTTTCYTCYECPDGMHSSKKTCKEECGGDCVLTAEQKGLSCYSCKKSCPDVCTEYGYDPPGTDYSEYIAIELDKWTCVSGTSMQVYTATIGECVCTKKPDITINEDVPTCPGTVCGNIACGEQVTCDGPSGEVTQSCVWKGWKELGQHQYQAQITIE